MASFVKCIVLLAFGVSLLQTAQAQRCSAEDEDELLHFKGDLSCNDINNPSIPCQIDSWVPGTDCCTWNGVTCTAGRVTSLRMSGFFKQPMTFQLVSSFQPANWGAALARMTELQELEFQFVGLNVALPKAWGSIPKLQRFHSEATSFFGELPREWGKLKNLESIFIDTVAPGLFGFGLNGTTGIAKELCSLSKLKKFYLRYHPNLSGGIPSCIEGWSSIEEFQFFNGGDENGRDFSLKAATASGLTGVLPAGLGKLKNLRILNLNANSLGGWIPGSLGYLTALQQLNLGQNRLTGKIPAEVGNLKNLTALALYRNKMFGELPTTLGYLKALVGLDLGSNGFYGSIPDRMYNLPNVQRLRLDDNRLWGPLPRGDYLGRDLSVSFALNVSWNFLDGPLNPRQLPSNVAELYMSTQNGHMAFTTISPTIGVLKSLRVLDLSQNQLQGTIPSTFNDLPNLQQVDLSLNELRGTVPAKLKAISAKLRPGNPQLTV